MCQMRVVLNKDGKQEKIMDAIQRLQVTAEGLVLNALFEKPMLIEGGRIEEIDFLDGVLVLSQADG